MVQWNSQPVQLCHLTAQVSGFNSCAHFHMHRHLIVKKGFFKKNCHFEKMLSCDKVVSVHWQLIPSWGFRATPCGPIFSWISVTGQQCPTLTWAGRRRESNTSTKPLASCVWQRWRRTCWAMMQQHSTCMSHVSHANFLDKSLSGCSMSISWVEQSQLLQLCGLKLLKRGRDFVPSVTVYSSDGVDPACRTTYKYEKIYERH